MVSPFHSGNERKVSPMVPHNSHRAKKFKLTQSAGKVMTTVFWDRKEVLFIDLLNPGTIINLNQYGEYLHKLQRAIQKRRQGRLPKGVR